MNEFGRKQLFGVGKKNYHTTTSGYISLSPACVLI
jgi:hypothetical protein